MSFKVGDLVRIKKHRVLAIVIESSEGAYLVAPDVPEVDCSLWFNAKDLSLIKRGHFTTLKDYATVLFEKHRKKAVGFIA